MRNILTAIALGMAVLLLCIALGMLMSDSQPKYNGQLKNAYWPYSVETQIRDK